MIEICACGFPKKKHLNLEELNAIKNLPQVEAIVKEVLTAYMKDMEILGNALCLLFRQDNLRALEVEAIKREVQNG